MRRYSTSLVTRETQIQTPARYHWHTPLLVIERFNKDKYWQRARKTEMLIPCWWTVKWYSLWKPVWQLRHQGTYPREMKNIHPHKYLHMSVQWSVICNRQKVGAAQEPMSWWTDKQNVLCPYNEILFGNRKARTLTHATTWVNLRNIMLSNKRSQTQETTYYTTPFGWNVQKSKIYIRITHISGLLRQAMEAMTEYKQAWGDFVGMINMS